jgi:hypothetical protein
MELTDRQEVDSRSQRRFLLLIRRKLPENRVFRASQLRREAQRVSLKQGASDDSVNASRLPPSNRWAPWFLDRDTDTQFGHASDDPHHDRGLATHSYRSNLPSPLAFAEDRSCKLRWKDGRPAIAFGRSCPLPGREPRLVCVLPMSNKFALSREE